MNTQKNLALSVQIFKYYTSTRLYSVKPKDAQKKALTKLQSTIQLEVETDTHKLASEVCGTNLYIEGGENIKIKPDSEYPDWLWKAHTGAPLPLEKLDPSTKEYWQRVRLVRIREAKEMLKYQKYKTLQK